MPTIELTTLIEASCERVFDLARSIDLHTDTMGKSGEKAIAGVTTGLIGLNDEVTWSAKHFGVRQELSVRITECDRPTFFSDVMIKGAFCEMTHHHYFDAVESGTAMRDIFYFESPLGVLGRIASSLFLTKYMRNLLADRNDIIGQIAGSDRWMKYVQE